VPWSGLEGVEVEKRKDRNNVTELLRHARDVGRRAGPRARWRRLIRIGVMGPLRVEALDTSELHKGVAAFPASKGADARDHHLEIVTPNAPGFDRLAPVALARIWARLGGAAPDLLRLEAGTLAELDRFALPHIDEVATESQTNALAKVSWGRNRRLGWPVPAELSGFLETAEAGADRMFALCDLVIVTHDDDTGAMTRRAVTRNDGATRVLHLSGVTYSAGAPMAVKS